MSYKKERLTAANRRRALIAYEVYNRSGMYSLDDAYGSYSKDKRDAWHYCERLMDEYSGYGLKVISANGWMFTAGFMFCGEEGQLMFMYITKNYDIAVEVAV
jgi:hypothetical protein